MTEHPLASVVEAVLLAAGRPVSVEQLLELFDEPQRPPAEELHAALQALQSAYEGRGVELREVASGWRVQVRPQHADVVSRLWQERPSRYSRALLETLALIAYRQPITRGEIEDIRGVTVSTTIMRTLHERSWIRVVGHREVPGRPELLGTTREFLDYFGLKSLDDLPTLAELRDLEDIREQLDLPDQPIGAAAAANDADPPAPDRDDTGPGATSSLEATAASDEPVASDEDVATDEDVTSDDPEFDGEVHASDEDDASDADLERTPA
ncbi:MAG TPA: SMC-Scp complex subunit ScpB [Steroidobacteraceae bacterium]|nr:SMC-Scp complex subunit ScpB [Steroidobacteraceae bacterium]